MSYQVQNIEGTGPSYAQKLSVAWIRTTNDLLKMCCDARGRKDVSATSGVREDQLLKWANMADLMRIPGVGSEFSELLEAAGVDTVKELRTRNPENLAVRMREANAVKKLTRSVPSTATVTKWIGQAHHLTPLSTH